MSSTIVLWIFTSHGLIVSGFSPDMRLVESVELAGHPWFVGVQFHPEFKSRPNRPHPLFRDFIGAADKYKNKKRAKIGRIRLRIYKFFLFYSTLLILSRVFCVDFIVDSKVI
jgi:hypothetical protein